MTDLNVLDEVEGVETELQYLIPTSRINRRFWAPGEEYNTGVYQGYPTRIRNARAAPEPFEADVHGFCLASRPTAITQWTPEQAGPGSAYAAEVCEIVRGLTGADLVIPLGGQHRTSGQTGATTQPPAGEAHVDFNPRSSHMVAQRVYESRMPGGPGYDRFIAFSLWRPFSDPPQDRPLALCDYRSVNDDEGTPNTKVDVDVIPTGDALFADIPGEEDMVAASIFFHNPAHRWWYFPDMTNDEVIFIKFFDSDQSHAWRALHTAFHDTSRPDAKERHSMEFRGIAYFSKAAA